MLAGLPGRRPAVLKKPPRVPAAAMPPPWLVEVVRPAPAKPPWAAMLRAAVAVCGPLALGHILGAPVAGLLGAMGGLLGAVVDRGGTYPARIKRVACAGVFGGAAGLLLGVLVHGRGWLAVLVLVLVAGLSAVLSVAGATAATTSLQLLVYTILGTGPLGALRPWWWPPALMLAGVAWSLLLLLPGWLASPLAAEQRSTAAVYRALAHALRAAGTPDFAAAHQEVVAALNAAWDDLASRRARTSGKDPGLVRIAALLNLTHPLTEAAVTAVQEGIQVAPEILDAMDGIADALQFGTAVPASPPVTGHSPGGRALATAVASAADVLAGRRRPGRMARVPRPSLRDRLRDMVDETVGGRLTRIFALRLMASVGVAEVIRQTIPVERSYWVVLTVAIVLRPDLGSVFARALQRGIGTVVGAVLGAVILVLLPAGPLLLVPVAVLAALLPYGRERNWGLFSTFLTPLVVLLIDLLRPLGWGLALDRLIDTLLGCAIVLVVGYAPWPSSWHAHLPLQLATALDMVARYTDQALLVAPGHSALRRDTYRALSDLRAEFQRTMAEPPSVSRRAARLWPALIGLEHVMDTVIATSVHAEQEGWRPAAAPREQLVTALRAMADSIRAGRPPAAKPLPYREELRPVADAIRDVQRLLASNRAA
jgi:uncharacterized membrane protein YccC